MKTDKFDLQYGIKKVVIEIEVDEIDTAIKNNTYGDALANTLGTIRNYVYHTDFIGEIMPIKGVTMTEYDEAGKEYHWKKSH